MLSAVLMLSVMLDQPPAASVKDPALREELVRRMNAEQDARFEFVRLSSATKASAPGDEQSPELRAVLQRMEAIDTENLAWLKRVVKEKGWPDKAMVGQDGAQGAFLIAQHAATDLDFMAECQEHLVSAYKAGHADGQWVALITDRLLILKDKKKQLYGTQLQMKDGQLIAQPIEDAARVDERRKAMGMIPLAEYLKRANEGRQPREENPPPTADEPGFVSLFNGRDLTGWRRDGSDLAGKAATDDGRFAVKDGILVITGSEERPPKMAEIDTAESYDGDFTLRLEFRASRDANSGLHLRDKIFAHQLQIRDYPRVGPYKMLKGYKEGDWNAIEVVVTGNKARCTCNGEVLETALEIPDKGPLSLQSEINVVEYRNIRIKTGK